MKGQASAAAVLWTVLISVILLWTFMPSIQAAINFDISFNGTSAEVDSLSMFLVLLCPFLLLVGVTFWGLNFLQSRYRG